MEKKVDKPTEQAARLAALILAANRAAARSPQAKWDRYHLVSFGCKLNEKEAGAFRAACQQRGLTPYAAIRLMVLLFTRTIARQTVKAQQRAIQQGGTP